MSSCGSSVECNNIFRKYSLHFHSTTTLTIWSTNFTKAVCTFTVSSVLIILRFFLYKPRNCSVFSPWRHLFPIILFWHDMLSQMSNVKTSSFSTDLATYSNVALMKWLFCVGLWLTIRPKNLTCLENVSCIFSVQLCH